MGYTNMGSNDIEPGDIDPGDIPAASDEDIDEGTPDVFVSAEKLKDELDERLVGEEEISLEDTIDILLKD